MDLTLQSEKYAAKKNSSEGTSYNTVKCPFKLIYKMKPGSNSEGKMEFELVRHEDKHIHLVDYAENVWRIQYLNSLNVTKWNNNAFNFFNFIYKTAWKLQKV